MNSIIRRLSSRSTGAQKKGVQRVREDLPQRLRQALATGARSWLRRSGSLSRFSHAPSHLHGLWREERKAGLSVGQHQIHAAVCHADWRLVSCHDDHRCGAADASRLAHRQGARQALHARAARACRASDAERHRRRRNIDRKATRLVVSDLERKRAIWFGGDGRGERDMDMFYAFLGKESADKIRLAVMDMWKPFRQSTQRNAPQAAILFDKFHILCHLGEALDKIRKAEY